MIFGQHPAQLKKAIHQIPYPMPSYVDTWNKYYIPFEVLNTTMNDLWEFS
jgi:hypothetical protein